MRIRIYPHNLGSHGASCLRDAFTQAGHNALLVRENGKYRPRPRDIIIGWGNSKLPAWQGKTAGTTWLNLPSEIPAATNKKLAFAKFMAAGVKVPEATVDQAVARGWLEAGKTVIGRQKLNASRGEGIVVMKGIEQFQACPLYTNWKSADREYRVYVLNGQVIDYLQKKRPNGAGDLGIIRSADNGWVYCRTNIKELPELAGQEAVKAVAALGLQFGGVDLLWGNKTGAWILEVNTAPGIEGVGVQKIAQAFIQQYQQGAN